MKNHIILLLSMLLFIFTTVSRAAELQAKTIDGQVIQGEYLGTENDIVRLKTLYGTVSIPSKNIVSLQAVNQPEKPDEAGAVAPANAEPAVPLIIEPETKGPPLIFREPKAVNLTAWIVSRTPTIPEAVRGDRLELFRLVRNFGDSSDASRQKIIRALGNFGLMAYPFIEGSYNTPNDLNDKVDLLQAVASAHKPYTAQLFLPVHAQLLNEMSRIGNEPPQLPPELITKRQYIPTRNQRLRGTARNVRAVEGFAATCGGPFNAQFLLNVYKDRYAGDSDALLKDSGADRARLAATAADHKNSASGWTAPDRVQLIETALPLYFKDNEDLRGIAEDFLKKLLPDRHPKWDAPQAEWVEWWASQRDKMK